MHALLSQVVLSGHSLSSSQESLICLTANKSLCLTTRSVRGKRRASSVYMFIARLVLVLSQNVICLRAISISAVSNNVNVGLKDRENRIF